MTGDHSILGRTVGALLILTGLGFMALVVTLLVRHDVSLGDVTLIAILLGSGALLTWIGCTYLGNKQALQPVASSPPKTNSELTALLIKHRPLLEMMPVIGCCLMVARFIALCMGISWPSATPVWVLTAAPAGISLLALCIRDAFVSEPLKERPWDTWPVLIALTVRAIFATTRYAYLVVPLALLDLDFHIFGRWRPLSQIIAASLISLLYATQFLALHFADIAEPKVSS